MENIASKTYRRPDKAGVTLDESLVPSAHEAQGTDGRRGHELNTENGVNFADKLMPDVDGGLGN